jgi:hypothetical protein
MICHTMVPDYSDLIYDTLRLPEYIASFPFQFVFVAIGLDYIFHNFEHFFISVNFRAMR